MPGRHPRKRPDQEAIDAQAVLAVLPESGAVSVRRIERHLGFKAIQRQHALRHLENEGLVRVWKVGRSYLVAMTDEGRSHRPKRPKNALDTESIRDHFGRAIEILEAIEAHPGVPLSEAVALSSPADPEGARVPGAAVELLVVRKFVKRAGDVTSSRYWTERFEITEEGRAVLEIAEDERRRAA